MAAEVLTSRLCAYCLCALLGFWLTQESSQSVWTKQQTDIWIMFIKVEWTVLFDKCKRCVYACDSEYQRRRMASYTQSHPYQTNPGETNNRSVIAQFAHHIIHSNSINVIIILSSVLRANHAVIHPSYCMTTMIEMKTHHGQTNTE